MKKKIINKGAIEAINEALRTKVDCNAIYVNELNIVTPKIDNIIKFIIFSLNKEKFFEITLKVKGNIIINASNHL